MRTRKLLLMAGMLVMVLGGGVAAGATRTSGECINSTVLVNLDCEPALTSPATAPAAESTDAAVDRIIPPTEVKVVTNFVFVPGESLELDFYFDPRNISVRQGRAVRWTQVGPVEEPHTVTIVDQADLPQTLEEAFACEVCNEALAAHDTNGDFQVDVRVVRRGKHGLDTPGDSLWIDPEVGSRVRAEITAPAGTTLYYLCAIHPWMQGSINIR